MRTNGRHWGWMLLACVACRDITPPEVARSTPMPALAPYALWWSAMEACSGLRGDFASVRWSVGDSALLAERGIGGEYYAPRRQIVLAPNLVLDGRLVRHEMLHALLNQGPGSSQEALHPSAYFRGGCAGYVVCTDACAAAPGPPPTPIPAGAPVLSIAALGLRPRLQVTPASFPADSNGGWLLLAVSVQNPRPYAVVLQLDPPRALATQSFGARFENSGGPILQESDTMQFGPNEVRRFVFDQQTLGYGPGRHVALGTFNTAPADTVQVTIRP